MEGREGWQDGREEEEGVEGESQEGWKTTVGVG